MMLFRDGRNNSNYYFSDTHFLCSINHQIIDLVTPSCDSLHDTGMWRAIYPAASKVVCRRDLSM